MITPGSRAAGGSIRLGEVSKTYRTGETAVRVLDGADLDVEPGDPDAREWR